MNGDRFRPSDTTATRNLNLGDFHESTSVASVEYLPVPRGRGQAPDNQRCEGVGARRKTHGEPDNFRRNVRSTESLRIR